MIPSAFPPKNVFAKITAQMLLDIEAVHFNAETPFTFASGKKSPVYINCRRRISFPRIRWMLMGFLAATILRDAGVKAATSLRDAGMKAFDNVAGGETAGIPFAALIAERLSLPMTYVRKHPKGYGQNARIEGEMAPGQRVLLVEDMATDGGSKMSFIEAIRATGATCGHAAVVFYYDTHPKAVPMLADAGVTLSWLCTWRDVLAEARARQTFPAPVLDEVERCLGK